MITLKHTVLLVSIAFVGACATAKTPAPAAEAPPAQAAVPPPPMENHGCPGANPGIKPIRIKYGGNTIEVTPPHAGNGDPGPAQYVRNGDVLKFILVAPPPNGKLVSTSGENAEAGWLNGSGKRVENKPATHQFYICVPEDLVPLNTHVDFKYNVDVVGKPRLDPIVRVKNP